MEGAEPLSFFDIWRKRYELQDNGYINVYFLYMCCFRELYGNVFMKYNILNYKER